MLKKFYILALYLILPLVFLRLVWRGIRNPGYWHRWKERLGFVAQRPTKPCIWVHAVSVGEVRAAAPLVNRLFDSYPDYCVCITTMTPTGSDQVKLLFGEKVLHNYVPYDLPAFVSRFIARIEPVILLVMETELWPNIFHLCRQRSVPIVMVNVRLSEKSMRGYSKIRSLVRATLDNVDRLAVQTETDAARLRELGVNESAMEVTGSMKFDIALPASVRESGEALRREWGPGRPVWVAASTHEGEDEKLLKVYRELKTQFADLLLVLVPRHPERFASVARLCRKAGFRVVLRSEAKGPLEESVDILVGDTMGELLRFFAASDLAFIGGSLVAVGGHNLLEAAALGKPVIFGPHMLNFNEISNLALEHGAGVQVRDAPELLSALENYLGNPDLCYEVGRAGQKMVEDNRGALDKTLSLVDGLLIR